MNFSNMHKKGPRRMVCVCAWCRKVRTYKGSWKTPAAPVRKTSRTAITHGICPQCASKMLAAEVLDGNARDSGRTKVVYGDDTGPSKIRQN